LVVAELHSNLVLAPVPRLLVVVVVRVMQVLVVKVVVTLECFYRLRPKPMLF
jgi:hypothetical protein